MLLRVGLTGGLASGKGVAAREFQRLGCHLIEADKLGHQVLLRRENLAFDAVLAEFGETILDATTGEIDRRRLGAIVFADPARLAALTAITHPAIEKLAASRMSGLTGIVIYEAAILIETGGYRNFDRIVLAACPVEMQIERAMARDGLSRQAVLERLKRQLPLADKLPYAHYVIDTSGTIEQTLQQTRNIYHSLIVYGETAPS
ncbi:dephospho-CoA kinase [Bryobacterales bacterium F-183]|nr:dephospho-CoA kinase [Bryobacterales bacterium F-183]